MASPGRSKAVCQTCGDRGTVKLLLSCVQCNDSFVHHYCLDNFNPNDDNIEWKCEDCVPKASKVSPIRKSERITKRKDRAVKVRVNWRSRLSKNGSTSRRRTAVKSGNLNTALPGSVCSLPVAEEKRNQLMNDDILGNQESTKNRREVLLEDEDTLGDNCIEDNVPLSSSSNVLLKMANCLPLFGPDNQFLSLAPTEKKKNQLLNDDTLVSQEQRTKRRRLVLEDEAAFEEEPNRLPPLEPDNHFISSAPTEETKNQLLNDNTLGSQESRKKRRRLVLEDEADLEENSAKASISLSSSSNVSLSKPEYLPSLAPGDRFCAQPCLDHVWRGGFCISRGRNIINVGLLAHLSSNVTWDSKAYDAAKMLPPVLNIKILPRMEVWPKSFQNSPPTDDNIALYFFPESGRDEKCFDSVLQDVIEHDLALKAWMDDIELLVFSSRVLPQQHWRFRKKYYLWGVFKPRQPPTSPETTKSPVTISSGVECVSSDLKDLPITATKTWSRPLNDPPVTATKTWSRLLKDLPATATKNRSPSSLTSASSHVSNPPPPSPFLRTSTSSSPESFYRSDRTKQRWDEVRTSRVHEERGKEGRANGVTGTKSAARSNYLVGVKNHVHFTAHLGLKDRIGAGRRSGMNFPGKDWRNRETSASSGISSSSGCRRRAMF